MVRDWFLTSSNDYRVLAITRSAHSEAIASAVTKEAELGHLAGFFHGRQELGLYGKMNLNTAALGRGEIGRGGGLEATRPVDPQYWTRKTMAEDLKSCFSNRAC